MSLAMSGARRHIEMVANSKMRRAFATGLALSLVFVATACGGADNSAQPAIAESVTEATTNSMAESGAVSSAESILIDVRDIEEFASGHLPEALNIPFNDGSLSSQIPSLDPNASYRVYCRSGNRSGQAVALMLDAGFTNVVDLGGLEAAVSATGLELVTD
jgi:rhodanese-related sulfurtransferase